MRSSGGGQNGEEGQVDEISPWVGVAEHLHGLRWTRFTTYEIYCWCLMGNGCHVTSIYYDI